jgi:hypothetical protein
MAGNAFDRMAKPKGESKKSTSTKIAAIVTDAVKLAVDKAIELKGKLKALEAEEAQAQEIIISHVKPQYRSSAKTGNFSKSFLVQGNTGAVSFVATDRFSVPKDEESQAEIKTCVGKKRFEEWFETKRTVSLKEGVLSNDELVNKIVETLSEAGIEDIFEVTDQLVAKDDLDRKQHELDDEAFETFSALVKQAKPSIK